jgi:serine/threonine protein kinase
METTSADWNISIDDIELSKLIYENVEKQSKVYKGTWRSQPVCIKQMKTEDAANEIDIMSKCIHPHVIQFLGANNSDPTISNLLFEYAEYGDLDTYIRKTQPKPGFDKKINILLQIALGFEYLSKRQPNCILHRDIKPSNILVMNNYGDVKISDFGISKKLNMNETQSYSYKDEKDLGTLLYMSPETILEKDETMASDMYSFGLVMFFVWSNGRKPFINSCDDTKDANLARISYTKCYEANESIYYRKLGTHLILNTEIKTLIESCCCRELDKRPNFKTVIEKLRKIQKFSE